MFPERPGYKWVSHSDTAGEDWSEPAPLCDAAGEPIQSGSSGSALFRSERNGRLYWIGNLCLRGEKPKGNYPRTTLYVVEVREEPFALRRETSCSSWTATAPGGHEDWWRSDYYRYRVALE